MNKVRNNQRLARLSARRPRATTRFAAGLCVAMLLQLDMLSLAWRGEALSSAVAQERTSRTMAVLVLPKSKRDTKQLQSLERFLRGFTRRLEDVTPVDLSPPENALSEAEVSPKIEEALRALIMRDLPTANARLAAVKAKLDAAPATGGARMWARYYKARSLTALARNRLVDASNDLVKSLILFERQTDSEYVPFGTKARQLLRTVKSAVDRQQSGDLQISGTQGAQIWVDGKLRGRVPTTLHDIKAGVHRVALRMSGMSGTREMIAVKVGETTKIKRTLKRSPLSPELTQGREFLRLNFKNPELVEDRIRELGNRLGANMMLVVQAQMKRKATTFTGYMLGHDGAVSPVATELVKDENYLDNMAAFVATSAAATLTADPDDAPLDQRSVVIGQQVAQAQAIRARDGIADGSAAKPPLTKQWWFWAAVGGGAVLLGTVTYLIASSGEEEVIIPTGTVTVNVHKTAVP